MSANTPESKLFLVPNAEEEGVKAEKNEPNLKPVPRELSDEERLEEERLVLIKNTREDIRKLMAADENGVRKIYDDLVSYDQDAKLYLGSRPLGGIGDGIACLGWPNYQRMNMRQAILNLFNEKLRKLERRPFSL